MLNILHTADWHLGHSLHGIARDYEHQCFFQWLLEQLQAHQVDALIIAGDIFDSANPSASAQSMLYEFLVQVRQKNPFLDIVLIGGNHDSAARLDAPAPVLQSLGIKVVGGLTRLEDNSHASSENRGEREIDWQRLIVPLTDKDCKIQAVCGAMPFIRNADLASNTSTNTSSEKSPEDGACDDQADPLITGVAELYRKLFEQMQHYKSSNELDDSIAQVMTGHCYMVGTELSELSERRILGGNQHALPSTIFDNSIDYVALGHLHKSQQVRSTSGTLIHYSGSPLPLSFSEKNYQHKVLLVTLSHSEHGTGVTQVESLVIPRAVDMLIIPAQGYATLSELQSLISEKLISFPDDKDADNTDETKDRTPLLEVRVALEKPEPGLRQQIEAMLNDKMARLLKITTQYPGKNTALSDIKAQTRLEELHPEDVFEQCYRRKFDQAPAEEMTQLFHQLLESVEVKD